jgi:CRISPR-associated protein Cmr1
LSKFKGFAFNLGEKDIARRRYTYFCIDGFYFFGGELVQRVEAVYRIDTPLFMGEGFSNKESELRPSAIKGVLRFWYRATALGLFGSFEEVKEKEAILFGSTDNNVGQAKFLLKLEQGAFSKTKSGTKIGFAGTAYLGYGLLDYKGALKEREAIEPGNYFKLDLVFRPNNRVSDEEQQALLVAVKALGLFGGLGSRSRRGFGSVTLKSLQENHMGSFQSLLEQNAFQENIEQILKQLKKLPETLPPYTAFSRLSRVIIINFKEKDPLKALEKIGREMIRYRSYGRMDSKKGNHYLPWDEEAQQYFADDHDLALDFAAGKKVDAHPRRVVFGLPHNYYFQNKIKVDVNASHEEYNRRASPLFISLHKLKDGCAAVLTFLPAVFLPTGTDISLSTAGKRGRQQTVPSAANYNVVHAFLDNLLSTYGTMAKEVKIK